MTDNKKTYTIRPEGSLGLLALGDIGIEKWREVRKEKEANEPKIKPTDEASE